MDILSKPITLYLKAGPDGTSVGDCPFAHYVQMVLHEKQVSFKAQPATKGTKPKWIIDKYGGSLPALQCGDDEICMVESDAIAKFVDESVTTPPHLASGKYTSEEMKAAGECTNGFFPAVARYFKHTINGDEEDLKRKAALEEALGKIEAQLGQQGKSGPFLAGNGENITLLDCSMIPKLYHLSVGMIQG